MNEYRLFSTLGCHLCDEAEALLIQYRQAGHDISWTRVEIAECDDLIERYGVRIPVVQSVASASELDWPFGYAELIQFCG